LGEISEFLVRHNAGVVGVFSAVGYGPLASTTGSALPKELELAHQSQRQRAMAQKKNSDIQEML